MSESTTTAAASGPEPDPQHPHSPETYRSRLSWEQLNQLLLPVDAHRVGRANGQNNMEAYEIRAHLNRIFGFANWDGETVAMELVTERWGQKHPRGGGQAYDVVTVIYRAHYVLRVRATDGTLLATYSEWAMGDAINFSENNLGKAHDFAIKTAESQAMKRCATNLGDQFGLSLYAGGSFGPVVQWTMNQTRNPHAEQGAEQMDTTVPTVTPETDPDAPPTQGEPNEDAWTDPRNARDQAGAEDPDLERARQDHAAQASQTRPHPNSRPAEQTPPPGDRTHLTPEQGQAAPAAPARKTATGIPQGMSRIQKATLPITDEEFWWTKWDYYASFGPAGFRYFMNIALWNRSGCPNVVKGKLEGKMAELEAAENNQQN